MILTHNKIELQGPEINNAYHIFTGNMKKYFFSTASSKHIGNLYAARNSINASDVAKDPGSNFYANSDFFDKVVKEYIVTAAFQHFQMNSVESERTINTFTGDVGNSSHMKIYLMNETRNVVKKYAVTEFRTIPAEDYQQSNNEIIGQICGKSFKEISYLRTHGTNIHGQKFRKCQLRRQKSQLSHDCDQR